MKSSELLYTCKTFSVYHGLESQNHLSWEGPLKVTWSKSPAVMRDGLTTFIKKYGEWQKKKKEKQMCVVCMLKITEYHCILGFTCALQKEILYQGKLFLSENWICFHSKVFGKDTKVSKITCTK